MSNLLQLFSRGQSREAAARKGGDDSPPPEPNKGGSYEDNTVRVNTEGDALRISAYYRGVELRTRTMSQLIWEYQRRDTEGGNYVTASRYGDSRRLNYLMQVRPNPLMTASAMLKNLELNIIRDGNGVIYIDRDRDGAVRHLWLCHSASYDIIDDSYSVNFNAPGGQRSLMSVPSADVIHIRNTFSYNGGLTGVGTLYYMADTLSLDATNKRLQTTTAAKGGKVKLLVQEEKNASQGILARANQKEVRKATERLNDEIYQKDVVLLDNVAGVTPISMTSSEMEILNSRRFSVEEISRFLAVPKMLLGDGSNSSYKTPEAAMEDFLLHTIQPNIRELEDELASKLLGPEDFGRARIHVCDRYLRRLAPDGQANLNKKLIEMGVKSINDVRRDYDMPSVADGDRIYVSAQWAELGSDKLRSGATPATPKTGEKGGEG